MTEHNSPTETRQFQAETKQLLDLMIHSIYSHKEIFLRELISNSSDAIDKLKYESITNPELKADQDFAIRVETDKDKRTLTVSDNGIGMSYQEVVDNIGTIARSGTKELLQKLKEQKESVELIGQFGVGFYSSFMVADNIELVTRKAGEQTATRWQSKGDGSFTIENLNQDIPSTAGTVITLHLKAADQDDSLDDFTDTYVLKNVIKKYSDFIAYPIILKEEVEKEERDAEGKIVEGGKKEIVIEENTVNSQKPIWTRPRSEVKDEEYNEFYRHISHDWQAPLRTIPFQAEGRLEYRSLLFIPEKAPFDFYYQNYEGGLQLYVRRVMIMDNFKEILPRYLRFVKGVVDSSDLPLNISREILQKNKVVTQMSKALSGKILKELSGMLEKDYDTYLKFWQEFGAAIKEGVNSDYENKEALQNLLLFESSLSDGKFITLKTYTERMKSEQKDIYYIVADSRSAAENSPYMEAFAEKGIEVLYLLDPIDEFVFRNMFEYAGKSLKVAAQGKDDIESGEEKEKKAKELEEKKKEYSDLISFLQDYLKDNVKEVKLSAALRSAPAGIAADEFGMSPQLEKMLQAAGQKGQEKLKRILEVNPSHEITRKLQERFTADKEDPVLKDYADLLLGYALMAEGAELPDAAKFNRLMAALMSRSL